MKLLSVAALAAIFLIGSAQVSDPPRAAERQRVTVSGEFVDSWCTLTEIMFPLGSAHHQCAIWCAVGGIPVGLLGEDGRLYIVLRSGKDAANVADPALLKIQSHKVTAEAELIRRDGLSYLLVDRVVQDEGIVNLTHEQYGIQPFGE